MSSKLLISVRNVAKEFIVSKSPMYRLWIAFGGKVTEPAMKVKVLKNVNFEVHRGEAIGIMGRNGAGKSTLLSIVCGMITPTAGEIDCLGTLSASLNVSSGFNPDFSGRQNAELFCKLHLQNLKDFDQAIQNIYKFSELENYFDMPVRTYSSGMRARLAFSCSALVNADVIVIDETLAVGDASFKMKCLDHLKKLKSLGQTFIIVSHSPNLISNFCSRVIVLDAGVVCYDDEVFGGLKKYKEIMLRKRSESQTVVLDTTIGENFFYNTIVSWELSQKTFFVQTYFKFAKAGTYRIGLSVKNMDAVTVTGYSFFQDISVQQLNVEIPFVFEFLNQMAPGQYFFDGVVYERREEEVLLSNHANIASYFFLESPSETQTTFHAGATRLCLGHRIESLKKIGMSQDFSMAEVGDD